MSTAESSVNETTRPMMAEVVRVPNNPSSKSRAGWIEVVRREHGMAMSSAQDLLDHSIACGKALIELRSTHKNGTWMAWCQNEFGIGTRLTRDYMQLARNEERIRHLPTKNAALMSLRDDPGKVIAPQVPYLRSAPLTDDELAEARRLRAEGMSWEKLGAHFDRSYRSVQRQMDPASAKRFNRNRAKERQRANKLQAIRLEEERNKLVKSSSPDLSTPYGHIRKALAALDRFESSSQAVRNRVAETSKWLVEAEGSIVQAMRAERQS